MKMRVSKWIWTLVLMGSLSTAASAQSQPSGDKSTSTPASSGATSSAAANGSGNGRPTSAKELVDRIIKREHDQIALINLYRPIIETYIQDLKPDKEMGFVPSHDFYYLAQANFSRGIAEESLLPRKLGWYVPLISGDYIPEGFLRSAYVDRDHFDKEHYQFQYVGKTFLGDVRCWMFDVTPSPKAGKELFSGRIWVEDEGYTIVRFNGIYLPQRSFLGVNAHFDSWRANVQPDLWLPALIFSQELSRKQYGENPFRAQTRFWGYSLGTVQHESEFSDIVVDSPAVQDDAATSHDKSPVEAERMWQQEAEENTVDTLVRDGLIAPTGPVDKVLDTVLNNLIVTNNLNIEPEPHCRVFLTSKIEAFSLNHTIILSRGLLDVLPDEATLAAVIAEQLSDALVPKLGEEQYGFADTLQIPTQKALKQFSFKDSRDEWQATGEKAISLLRNSPYRNQLGTTGLFLKQLSLSSKSLPQLINPNLGNRIYPVAELLNSGQALRPEEIKQIPALPLGARIKLDPWSDEIELVKANPPALQSAREKKPLEITPFMPYLTRYSDKKAPASGGASSGQGGAK
jgi:hypothetical protein